MGMCENVCAWAALSVYKLHRGKPMHKVGNKKPRTQNCDSESKKDEGYKIVDRSNGVLCFFLLSLAACNDRISSCRVCVVVFLSLLV